MPTDPSFRMKVLDVWRIYGRGTTVTGQVESGTLGVWQVVYIKGENSSGEALVTDMMSSNKRVKRVSVGDVVGVLLRGLPDSEKKEVDVGDILMGSNPD